MPTVSNLLWVLWPHDFDTCLPFVSHRLQFAVGALAAWDVYASVQQTGTCLQLFVPVCWFEVLATILFECLSSAQWGCSWSRATFVGSCVNLRHGALLGCVLFLFDPARPLLFEGVLIRCDLLGTFGGGWLPLFTTLARLVCCVWLAVLVPLFSAHQGCEN